MTLWVRRLTVQQLREEYRTAVTLEVRWWGAEDARRRYEFVGREMTRRGLDP